MKGYLRKVLIAIKGTQQLLRYLNSLVEADGKLSTRC